MLMIDKNFCMSSYLAFRYIERDDTDFFEGLHHENIKPVKDTVKVSTAAEIDAAIADSFSALRGKKFGVMLSGGMDSAIVASYVRGSDAYTFRFLGGNYQKEELERAEYYAKTYSLNLHYVDINWQTIEPYIDSVMRAKGAPVHSIEPQLLVAAEQAKADGIECIVIGDASDYIFGGMDKLLSRDWTFDEFAARYTYLDPEAVLVEPADVSYLFERYRIGDNAIDWMRFLDDISTEESYGSYDNAFKTAQIDYFDPYANLAMGVPLDLQRIRNGESKYLIRELFAKKYPDFPVPNKTPMPRPVDFYFKDYQPTRPEFKQNLDMTKFTGNQKWQMYCLERFLNLFDPIH